MTQNDQINESTEVPHGGQPHVLEPDYVVKRRTEYPDFIEYIDGLVKGDIEQMQAYIDKCKLVKEKYPKV
jgi:hypothetical protein